MYYSASFDFINNFEMEIAKYSILLFASYMTCFSHGQVFQGCPCHNTSSAATWGELVQSGICEGQCHLATRTDFWTCFAANGQESVCPRSISCTLNETCTGEWSKWDNVGPCVPKCGLAFRNISRTCYERAEIPESEFRRRTNLCVGSNGEYVQTRIAACNNRTLCFTTSNNPTTTIKPTRGEASELVTNSDESTTAEVTTLTFSQPQATISQFFENDSQIRPVQSSETPVQMEQLTLAAVLCSVGLVYIAVVIVTLTLIKNRRAANSWNRERDDESNEYETVTRMTPSSFVIRSESLGQVSQLSAPSVSYNQNRERTFRSYQESSMRPIHNMNMRSNRQMSLQTIRNFNSAGIYLKPHPSPSTRSLPVRESQNREEAIYTTIDDDTRNESNNNFDRNHLYRLISNSFGNPAI